MSTGPWAPPPDPTKDSPEALPATTEDQGAFTPAPATLTVAKYCSACGNGLIATAVVCPRCGTPAAAPGGAMASYQYPSQPMARYGGPVNPQRKSKTAAVWLVVLFGFFGWLYTYKFDAAKFWIAGGLTLFVALPLLIAYGLGFLIGIPIYIWAIVSMASRPREFYEQYPNYVQA